MSRYLLDTGIVLRHLRGNRRVVNLLRQLGRTERLSISVITRLEVYAGMHENERQTTQKLLSRFLTYNLDATIADRSGEFVRQMRSREQALSMPDAIIAATAVQHHLTLITLNQKDFAGTPGLSLYPLPEGISS
ncbi:MAG TPA: type II toxin-antitoxin system VapC family toxin [Chloroflexota bacterium]|nr:type II toxin-antitoxin system VapC family toxin [Chloroflexota bacterium]